jgi:hypothetical protein
MKFTLPIILFLALVCSFASGQAANQVFPNDTTKGAQTKYFTGTKEAGVYQGIVGFTFTTAHNAAKIYLEGCYTTNAWYKLDSVTATTATVNQLLYQTPPKFKYYRLRAVGIVSDTCRFSNVRYFLKY